MTAADSTSFTHLINLADGLLGAKTIDCSDDFFAAAENLVKPGRGEFDPDAYYDRGKVMDGWESRRKRGPGHDWCVLQLGAAGHIRALDIDTNHFLGNHPPYASVDAARSAAAPSGTDDAAWTRILDVVPLRPGSQNPFILGSEPAWPAWTHLRLNIYPDGGVARLRAHGVVEAPSSVDDGRRQLDAALESRMQPGEIDLAAVSNGGLALACSDSFFGPMNNLILPGRSVNMGGGWETRRRRGPGHDWIIVRLGVPGTPRMLELDTNFFKGNFPDTAQVHGIMAPDASLLELVSPDAPWSRILGATKLKAHERRFLRDELTNVGPCSHVRLRVDPDGGVSRLRVCGEPVWEER